MVGSFTFVLKMTKAAFNIVRTVKKNIRTMFATSEVGRNRDNVNVNGENKWR